MQFPPGPKYLAKTIPRLLVPPAVIYAAYCVATGFGHFKISLPLWLKAVILVLSVPATLVLRNFLSQLKQIRESRAMGGVRVPFVKHTLPGGLDLLRSALIREKTAYLGLSQSSYGID